MAIRVNDVPLEHHFDGYASRFCHRQIQTQRACSAVTGFDIVRINLHYFDFRSEVRPLFSVILLGRVAVTHRRLFAIPD